MMCSSALNSRGKPAVAPMSDSPVDIKTILQVIVM